MTWTILSALILGALAFVPVFLLLHIVAEKLKPESYTAELEDLQSDLVDGRDAAVPPMEVPSWSGARSSSPTPHVASRPTHRLRRIIRMPQPTDTVADARSSAAFDYTIRRHTGAVWQSVPDLGGFANVPFLLRDRMGNCVTIHRRVSLN